MKKKFAIALVMVLALTLIGSTATYDPKNEIHTTLNTEFVHGTDMTMILDSATGFPSDGGYIRISGILTDLEWALYEYTGISTNTLTGLIPCTEGNVESTAAHTFAAASIVELINAAEYLRDLKDMILGNWYIASYYADLATAVSTIQSASATLIIDESEAITSDLTIPATMDLMFLRGGDIEIQTDSATLTPLGGIVAGHHQIFSGVGNVDLSSASIRVITPQWFGVVADGAIGDGTGTDNSTAFGKVLASAGEGSVVEFPQGVYLFETLITIGDGAGAAYAQNIGLQGVSYASSADSSVLLFKGCSGIHLNNTGYSQMRDLIIYGYEARNAAATAADITAGTYGYFGLRVGESSSMMRFQNVIIRYFDTGLYVESSTYFMAQNIDLLYNNVGMITDGTSTYTTISQSNFRNSYIHGVYSAIGNLAFEQVLFEGNGAQNGTDYGIKLVDRVGAFTQYTRTTLTDCYFESESAWIGRGHRVLYNGFQGSYNWPNVCGSGVISFTDESPNLVSQDILRTWDPANGAVISEPLTDMYYIWSSSHAGAADYLDSNDASKVVGGAQQLRLNQIEWFKASFEVKVDGGHSAGFKVEPKILMSGQADDGTAEGDYTIAHTSISDQDFYDWSDGEWHTMTFYAPFVRSEAAIHVDATILSNLQLRIAAYKGATGFDVAALDMKVRNPILTAVGGGQVAPPILGFDEQLLSTTIISLAADGDTVIYTVPHNRVCVLTKAVLSVGANANSTDITIGQAGAENNWIDTTQLDNLDVSLDVALLMPVPSATPPKMRRYGAGTVIEINVANHDGGAANTLYLYGCLY